MQTRRVSDIDADTGVGVGVGVVVVELRSTSTVNNVGAKAEALPTKQSLMM